jgi:hypothetical protein
MEYWDGRSMGFDACRTRPKGVFCAGDLVSDSKLQTRL